MTGRAQSMKIVNGEPTYRATNEREFFQALGSDRTVIVAANTQINLTKFLNDEANFTGIIGRAWLSPLEIDDVDVTCAISEDCVDGQQLTLKNFKNLIISGEGNSSIVVEPRYSYVMNFVDCDEITLENLTIGHTEGGFCMGGVIGVTGGRNVMCKDCDLYGCGTYGLVAEKTTNVSLYKCVVHDCSYGLMQLFNSEGCRFYHCDFCDTGSEILIEGRESDVAFSNCRFYRNDQEHPLFYFDREFVLVDCDVWHRMEKLGTMDKCILPRDDVRFHDLTEVADIQPRTIGPDVSEEMKIAEMQSQAICGTWKWTDGNGVRLMFTLAMRNGQLAVCDCGIYGSTEFNARCTYKNGVLHVFDDSFSTPNVPAFDGKFELNPRGDLVGSYKLRQNGGKMSNGNITLRLEGMD